MGGSFINDPIVWPNSSRTWDNPAMPPDAKLEWDSRIYPAQTQPYGTGIRSTVGIKAVANYQVVARLFEDGPVLDEATVQGWVTYGSDQIAMNVITTYEDGTQLYEITIQNMGLPPDGQMVIWIMAGGIVYADGTTSVTLTADDFDDTGACRLRMLVSPDSWTSFCHKMRVYQNGQWVWGN
jgi:hypothetical protein